MNLHFGVRGIAAIVTILLVVLLTAYSNNNGSPAPSSISRDTAVAPVNPSSPTLVTCGAEKNVYPTGRTPTIIMVPCGPY